MSSGTSHIEIPAPLMLIICECARWVGEGQQQPLACDQPAPRQETTERLRGGVVPLELRRGSASRARARVGLLASPRAVHHGSPLR